MADKNICKKEKENQLTLCNNLYRLTLICNLSCALLRCSCRISWLKNACLSWNVSDPPENKEQMNNTKRQLQLFFLPLFIFNHILQDSRKEFEVNFLQCKSSSIYGKEWTKKWIPSNGLSKMVVLQAGYKVKIIHGKMILFLESTETYLSLVRDILQWTWLIC